MKYRGVIFDFNGVLLWDAELQTQSWQVMAMRLRGRKMTEDEFALHMHGRPNGYVMSYLAGRTLDGRELADRIQEKESLYRHLCLDNPEAFILSPGARELLEALTTAQVPRTIATSSERTNLEFFIQHLELGRWFDPARIVYDDGTRPGKPAPDMYLAAAANLGLGPRDCIVVEDAVSGLEAARAAGIGYLIGLGPEAQHTRLAATPGVDRVITRLAQFPRELLLP